MPPIRPLWPTVALVSPGHVANTTSKEPPVTSDQPLSRLSKGDHVAEAKVRPIERFGIELRYEWNGELQHVAAIQVVAGTRGRSRREAPGA